MVFVDNSVLNSQTALGFSGRTYALLSFLTSGSAVIVLFVLIFGFSLWGEEPRNRKKAKILFIGNSFLASTGGQENLVPTMMKPHGWEVEATHCYGPGQTLKGHWHNNLGELTEEQIKDTATVKFLNFMALQLSLSMHRLRKDTWYNISSGLDQPLNRAGSTNF